MANFMDSQHINILTFPENHKGANIHSLPDQWFHNGRKPERSF
jgi:hypothetical protein